MDDKVELLLNGQQYKKLQEAYLSNVLEKYDLNVVDIRVLLFLHEHESCDTAKDIVERHYLTKSYVSKAVDKLIDKDFLMRKHLKDDRRYVHLVVKEDAFPVIDAVCSQRRQMLQRIFDGVQKEELDVLQSVARKVSENITEILEMGHY